jgi:pimeloyl-ACP methyl ester carboxylesterase
MVTGSGQQNRDEEIFGHKPFAVIADALARAGIATLRYDDRGFGESTGDLSSATTEDLKDDALAGVDLLRGRFDRVGVIGHSEGGTIALMIAAEGKEDFVVSLAGAVVSGAETLLWQNRLALSAAGLPDEAVETYCSLLSEAFDAVRAGLPMPSAANKDLPDGLKQNYLQVVQQLRIPYMQYFISLDMRPLLGGIGCPVLALNGSKDHQVEPVSNLGALKDGLPSNPATLVEEIEGLNHLFQHCKSGEVVEYKEIEETISPEVLDLMARWIGGL